MKEQTEVEAVARLTGFSPEYVGRALRYYDGSPGLRLPSGVLYADYVKIVACADGYRAGVGEHKEQK